MPSDTLSAAAERFLLAAEAIHSSSGSTAVHGGSGGMTITTHCTYTCHHSSHEKTNTEYMDAAHALSKELHAR